MLKDTEGQVDALLKRELEISERQVCPRCQGPRTDETRRFCAPCILNSQTKKMKGKR